MAPDSNTDRAAAVAHGHVQPGAASRIAGRELVAREIPDLDVEAERAALEARRRHLEPGGVVAQLPHGRVRGGLELRRQRRDAQLDAVAVEHPDHERVAAHEQVLRQAVPFVAEHRGGAHRPLRRRHVARLAAALLGRERAVLPFLVVHLFGQRTDHGAVGTVGVGDERVARRAQLRLTDVRCLDLLIPGHRSHDGLAAGVDGVRAVDEARAPRRDRLHDEVGVEALRRAEPIGRHLMADRARDPVGRQPVQRRSRLPAIGSCANTSPRAPGGLGDAL